MSNYNTKGWDQTNPGWHEIEIYVADPHESVTRYNETVDWVYDNIGKCERHCRWKYDGNYLRYKFRYERDYLWFKLSLG